jgi:hypothetical protein
MLLRLTRSLRIKAAIAVAALYAFCILLPAAAFGLADGRMAPPCLLDDLAAVAALHHATPAHVPAGHYHNGTSHDHAGAATHHHHGGWPRAAAPDPQTDPDHGKNRPGECCGLFPLVGLAGGLRAALAPLRPTSSVIPALTDPLIGREPDRIIRPPIG